MDQIRKLLVATYGRRKIVSQNQLHYLGWFSCFGLNYKCLNKLKPHGYFPKTDLSKFSSGHKVCIGYFFQYLPSSSLTTHNTIGYTLYPRPWNMNITIKSYSQGSQQTEQQVEHIYFSVRVSNKLQFKDSIIHSLNIN